LSTLGCATQLFTTAQLLVAASGMLLVDVIHLTFLNLLPDPVPAHRVTDQPSSSPKQRRDDGQRDGDIASG